MRGPGGGLSLLKGRAFSTPAAPKKSRASGAFRFDARAKLEYSLHSV